MDDFAWLGLRQQIYDWKDALAALLSPMAQGTIRPFSERIYFLTLEWLFGIEALPFRIVGFATQLLNLWLVLRLVERVTGSRAGGTAAALLWIVNSALAVSMSWTSAYNQILWPCVMLAGCHARWTWLETGSRRARVTEWVCFLLGFGVLELQVVYPAVAGALTLLYHRERWRDLPPLFAVAGAYAVLNRSIAKPSGSAVYALHWDLPSLLQTFGTYLRMATGIWRPDVVREMPGIWQAAEWTAGIGLAAAITWLLWRRERWALFGMAWFAATLAPVLPLKNHVSDYYLTAPVLGLAMAAGLAAARKPAWAIVPVVVYAAATGWVSRATTLYNYERAEQNRALFAGVREAAQLHPGKTILLTAVSSDQYWGLMNDSAFRLLEGVNVQLAPGGDANIIRHPELGNPAHWVMDEGEAAANVSAGEALVYSPAGGKLRNVTAIWKNHLLRNMGRRLAAVVDAAKAAYASQLGEGWHAVDGAIRWASGRVTVRVEARPGAQTVMMEAFRPDEGGRRGPVTVEALVNGLPAGRWESAHDRQEVLLQGPLPAGLDLGKPLTVEVRISPVLQEGGAGGRALGLAFGKIGVR
ncbi:MAG TPA: hypothetical protein VFQ91_26970 [Bryobacteraceae bacterium]|nr:hypothetical protein [Bryobacteraceae bacterium]